VLQVRHYVIAFDSFARCCSFSFFPSFFRKFLLPWSHRNSKCVASALFLLFLPLLHSYHGQGSSLLRPSFLIPACALQPPSCRLSLSLPSLPSFPAPARSLPDKLVFPPHHSNHGVFHFFLSFCFSSPSLWLIRCWAFFAFVPIYSMIH
jgi:hypothetical protein